MQPAGAPKLKTAKTSSLALLARLEPSLRFRFSLIALGRGDKSKMAARLRPAKSSNTARGFAYRPGQAYGAMLRMSPKPPQ